MAGRVDELLKKNAAVLPKRIQFKKAEKPDLHTEILRAKYEPINKPKGSKGASNPAVTGKKDILEDELKKPSYELFTEDKVSKFLKWDQIRRVGSGLNNLGNTCFLNSVLQCLSYTPPFANYCFKKEHSKTCQVSGFCMFCQLEGHVIRSLTSSGAVAPKGIVSNLRNISKIFRPGRQEDSHEFLRYVVEGLQKSCLHGMDKKLDPTIAETSVVHRIFGGYLQSQVECSSCKHKSNTFDPFLDLSLEIRGCDSVEKALSQFTRSEILDEANKYKCLKCLKSVRAKKQFSIRVAPNVLTIQLKRFTYSGFFGGKISKPVSFPTKLDLTPYLSDKKSDNPTYQLYGVLVHSGGSSHSGHYYSFIKNSAGIWHLMDDSSVTQVSAETALKQSAYMLFYVRDSARSSTSAEPDQIAASSPIKTKPIPPTEPKGLPEVHNRAPLIIQKRKQEEWQPPQPQQPQPQASNKKVKVDKIKPMLDEVPTTTYLFSPLDDKTNGVAKPLKRSTSTEETELQTPTKKVKREYIGTSNTPTKVQLMTQPFNKPTGEINGTKNVEYTVKELQTNLQPIVPKESQIAKVESEPDKDKTGSAEAESEPDKGEHATKGGPATSNGHAKLTNGHSALSNGHTKLTNGHAKLSNGHSKPTNGHAKLSNGHSASPSNGHAELPVPTDNATQEATDEVNPIKPLKITAPSASAEVVNWDESLNQEWTKKDALERKPKFDLVKRKKQVDMLQALTGFKSTQYAAKVDSWDEAQNKEHLVAQKSILREFEPREKKRDEWDVEYDKGHTKKVKVKKTISEDQANPFQGVEKRRLYPTGKRTRVKSWAKSPRGKGEF